MKTKHTPGPWHRNIKADGKYPVVFVGRSTHLAVCKQVGSPEETEANISLVAAAPDLLEALDELRGIIQSVLDGEYKFEEAVDSFTLQTANDAIRKATEYP